MARKRRFKKRYIIFILLAGLIGYLHISMTFRSSEEEQIATVLKYGQQAPTFHTYQALGQTMHYTHVGEEGKPLIIFLHGSPGSSSAFLSYLSDTNLTNIAQLVAVDRPGNGYSDFGKSEPSFERQAAKIIPIVDRHKASKVILVGHSLGGPIISRMAMDYPELVDGLIILAGSIDPALEPYEPYRKPMNWALLRWLVPKAFRVSNQEILEAENELNKMMDKWVNITCPVTVLQGENDMLVPEGNADFASGKIVNSRKLVVQKIPDENHFFIWPKKYLVDEAIQNMINEH